MPLIHDAIVIEGGTLPSRDHTLTADGTTADGRLGATIDDIDIIWQRSSQFISVGDQFVLKGTTYKLSSLFWTQSHVEAGIGPAIVNAAMLRLVDPANPQNVVALWIPYDNNLRESDDRYPDAGEIRSVTIYQKEATSYVYLSDFVRNERVYAMCFGSGTLIETATGSRAIETLRVGDWVLTRDHGFQPLRWLGGRRLSAADLARAPNLLPVRIAAGALGPDAPATDLMVSPQHRMLARSRIAERMSGSTEVLVAAVHLVGLPGVTREQPPGGIGYWHLMFDRHEIVFANGAEAESLHAGPMALAAMSPEARQELFAIFPDLAQSETGDSRALARPVLHGRDTRKLVERQVRNRRPLVSALHPA